MIDALEVLGESWENDNIDLCNAAWEIAKCAGFDAEKIQK